MGLYKVSGLVLFIGSVLFAAAAFSPVSQVFGARDIEKKVEILTGAPTQWVISQILFGLGAVVTALGIGFLAAALTNATASRLLWLAMSLLLVGAAFWSWHVGLRALDPIAFAQGEFPHWNFAVYSVLTQIGFVLVGIAILKTDLASWSGWMLIIGMSAFFVLMVIFRDMPPFVYYLLTAIVGVVVYQSGSAGPS